MKLGARFHQYNLPECSRSKSKNRFLHNVASSIPISGVYKYSHVKGYDNTFLFRLIDTGNLLSLNKLPNGLLCGVIARCEKFI